jgi:hypothetical protein
VHRQVERRRLEVHQVILAGQVSNGLDLRRPDWRRRNSRATEVLLHVLAERPGVWYPSSASKREAVFLDVDGVRRAHVEAQNPKGVRSGSEACRRSGLLLCVSWRNEPQGAARSKRPSWPDDSSLRLPSPAGEDLPAPRCRINRTRPPCTKALHKVHKALFLLDRKRVTVAHPPQRSFLLPRRRVFMRALREVEGGLETGTAGSAESSASLL